MSKRSQVTAVCVFAVVGLVLTVAAVRLWAPEASISTADREEVARIALRDAAELGFRVEESRRPQLSAGPRAYLTNSDVAVLRERVDSSSERQRLLKEVPPIRLGVRFWDAVGTDGAPGALLLEYDGRARLVGASFGWDGIVQGGLQPYAGPEFADRIAQKLLGSHPPRPETVQMGGGIEYVYRTGKGEPGVYVYLGGSARWIAHRQPVPYALLTRQFTYIQDSLTFQVLIYLMVFVALLALGDLLWRLTRRRAGFGHTWLLATLLAIGLLPALGHMPAGLTLFNYLFGYLAAQGAILLAWSVAEAEMRDVRPAGIEHWDRLVCRRPLAGTGRALVIGVLAGTGLAGLIAASGRLAEEMGGGYGGLLLILPDYWLLPTPLNWGLLLAASTAFLMSFGRRVASRPGAVAGAALSGLGWSFALPVAPVLLGIFGGIVLALIAGWVMSRFGLLAMTVACVTALSVPTAVVLSSLLPLRYGTFFIASLPLAILVLGGALWRRSPVRGSAEFVKPSYISQLESDAKLAGEFELLREFQLSLLPGAEVSEHLSQADVAWKMIPADTVGGDFLDLIEDESGRLWIAVADAAGHGIACSVLTAYTKAAVADHAGTDRGPAEALRGIRRLFGRLRTRRSMVTLLLAVWEPSTRRLTVANAGHPPLLIFDGDSVVEIGRPGSPLGTGLAGHGEYEDVLELSAGSVIVGYSDGVPEATSSGGATFGYAAWPESLRQVVESTCDAAGTLAALLAQVSAHRDGHPAEDDMTAVVLRLR